nr:hypothetical protein [Tanacetum cinerariifolium]
MDEPEQHPAYDFFALRSLPGYAGNPNNNNGWIDADVPLLGELGVEVDELMIDLVIDEVAELTVKEKEQVLALVIDVEKDIAMLFGDDDCRDDDSEGFEDDVEVGGPSSAVVEGHSLALPTPGFLVPPLVIEGLSTRMGNLEYGCGQLVNKVIQVSDVEVADDIAIGEIGPKVSIVEG